MIKQTVTLDGVELEITYRRVVSEGDFLVPPSDDITLYEVYTDSNLIDIIDNYGTWDRLLEEIGTKLRESTG